MFNLVIVVLGCALLIGLAVTIARIADQDAQRSAWNRIAERRRQVGEDVRALQEMTKSKVRCPRCGALVWPFDPDGRNRTHE